MKSGDVIPLNNGRRERRRRAKIASGQAKRERLHEIANYLGLTATGLANLLGVAVSTMTRHWEPSDTDAYNWRPETMQAAEAAYEAERIKRLSAQEPRAARVILAVSRLLLPGQPLRDKAIAVLAERVLRMLQTSSFPAADVLEAIIRSHAAAVEQALAEGKLPEELKDADAEREIG